VARNRGVHRLLVGGVTVEYRTAAGDIRGAQARVMDFDRVDANDWLAVNQFSVMETRHSRRPDVVLFVNGVEKGLAHLREIGLQCPETLGTTNLEPVAVLRNQRRDRRYHLLEHGRDLEGLEMHHRQRIHFRLTTVGPF
jgi:hypothetical protein